MSNPYVPWDIGIIYDGVGVILKNVGSGFNIALWVGLIVLAILVPFSIIKSFN